MSYTHANRILLALIVIINLYIIALPFYTLVSFWPQKHISHRPQQLAQLIKTLPTKPVNRPDEELIIPSIGVDDKIYEGPTVHTLHYGIWRYPGGSSPDKGGNTVLADHRFTYTSLTPFTHLDLVKKGDPIVVIWHGRKYDYTVADSKVIKPSDTSIIQPTTDSRLTLYTCTPMWTNKFRLAVIAQKDIHEQ